MQIAFNFKNFEPSDHLKEYAENRFSKLSKFVGKSDNAELQVNLSVEKIRQMAEVILTADLIHLSAFEESEDMYATIDQILDKVTAQVKRFREKQNSKRDAKAVSQAVRTEFFSFDTKDEGESERSIVETDSYEPKPMDVEEAALQLDTLDFEFLVFLNAETERVNVIYRRKNGDFGLIDPGM